MNKFKPKKDYVFLKLVGNTKTKSGIITSANFDPAGKPVKERYLQIDKIEVLGVGDEVKEFKKGDIVFPQGFVFNQVIPASYLGIEHDENIKYLWAKSDSIVGIVN